MELRTPTEGPPLTAAAVMVAAGRSTRMGGERSKALLTIAGRTVLERSAAALLGAASVQELVVVARDEDRAEMERALEPHRKRIRAIVPGGLERADSVQAGVAAVSDEVDVVLVHDAARCFVEPDDVERVARAAYVHGCALLATRVRDTLKYAPNGFLSEETADRDSFWTAQTPQGMRTARFRDVLSRAQRDGFRPTDDAALHEHYHGPSKLIEGRATNLKVTTPDDLPLAEALARELDERLGAAREQAG
ncbi:MAG: 2-C-methyl-D-erythritol 4-phosphate cytidylyltransferase [Planctomycetota bacterium]